MFVLQNHNLYLRTVCDHGMLLSIFKLPHWCLICCVSFMKPGTEQSVSLSRPQSRAEPSEHQLILTSADSSADNKSVLPLGEYQKGCKSLTTFSCSFLLLLLLLLCLPWFVMYAHYRERRCALPASGFGIEPRLHVEEQRAPSDIPPNITHCMKMITLFGSSGDIFQWWMHVLICGVYLSSPRPTCEFLCFISLVSYESCILYLGHSSTYLQRDHHPSWRWLLSDISTLSWFISMTWAFLPLILISVPDSLRVHELTL